MGRQPWSEFSDSFGLTRIEAKMYAKLAEGGLHSALDLQRIATDRPYPSAYSARVHIQHLRQKLETHGIRILNLPGAGYYIEASVRA